MLLLAIKVSGTSYILWAAENYQDCCKIADEIAAKDAEEETWITLKHRLNLFMIYFNLFNLFKVIKVSKQEDEPEDGLDDSQKMDEIIKCIR